MTSTLILPSSRVTQTSNSVHACTMQFVASSGRDQLNPFDDFARLRYQKLRHELPRLGDRSRYRRKVAAVGHWLGAAATVAHQFPIHMRHNCSEFAVLLLELCS